MIRMLRCSRRRLYLGASLEKHELAKLESGEAIQDTLRSFGLHMRLGRSTLRIQRFMPASPRPEAEFVVVLSSRRLQRLRLGFAMVIDLNDKLSVVICTSKSSLANTLRIAVDATKRVDYNQPT